MKIIIELNAMRFYAFHGVLPQETRVGNDFVVDISYACSGSEKASLSDDINDTISYADVYEVVKTEMERPSKMLEHVTARIATALKSQFSELTYLKVRLSKLNPPLGGEVYSASVTIEKRFAHPIRE